MMSAFDANPKPENEYYSGDYSHQTIKGSSQINAPIASVFLESLLGSRWCLARIGHLATCSIFDRTIPMSFAKTSSSLKPSVLTTIASSAARSGPA